MIGNAMGDLWIIAPATVIATIVEWLHQNVEDPRYVVHESGQGVAVAFADDSDRMLFDLRFPDARRYGCRHSVLDGLDW